LNELLGVTQYWCGEEESNLPTSLEGISTPLFNRFSIRVGVSLPRLRRSSTPHQIADSDQPPAIEHKRAARSHAVMLFLKDVIASEQVFRIVITVSFKGSSNAQPWREISNPNENSISSFSVIPAPKVGGLSPLFKIVAQLQ
jgi:hypothetical protein